MNKPEKKHFGTNKRGIVYLAEDDYDCAYVQGADNTYDEWEKYHSWKMGQLEDSYEKENKELHNCISRCWEELGIKYYTGASVSESIKFLKKQLTEKQIEIDNMKYMLEQDCGAKEEER